MYFDNKLVEAQEQELHKYALAHQIAGIIGRLGIEVTPVSPRICYFNPGAF
jgi:hypothetical protein